MTTLTLDPRPPFEATAAVLAAIAWPEDPPEGERQATARASLVAHILRAAATADPEWAWRPLMIKPGYLLMEAGDVSRSVSATARRLGQALTVARAARPFVGKALHGSPPPLPRPVSRLSLNAVIPFVLGDESETDPHNFEQRVFRRTLPVLHLAVALEHAIDAVEAAAGRSPGLEELFWMADHFLPWLVERGMTLEEPVLAIKEFKVPADHQLRVRLAG